MAKSIKFKSTPENWRKEWLGLKKNTIRKFGEEADLRQEILDRFIKESWNKINVEIENTRTFETFRRDVTDVTIYQGYYIISWD